ncbi:MAG TPA: FtsQ-type POTRA domain-containing protein, partial [Opitutus sp.]|nr:FtsQ-type POTRA domain-containing protein [Opitutus sp.]
SWRDIPQQVKPRAMSPEGRRRVVWSTVKTLGVVAILGGLGWGGFEIAAMLRGDTKGLAKNAEAVPVREVELITDGVLDHEWLVRTLALPRNVSLMELDLYRLQARLTAFTQVRSATLTRNFPSTLTVSLSEHSPVARVMAQVGATAPQAFLVAREGVVFEGLGFDPEMIATLPWLSGVKLTRRDDAFLPIVGMETVADLLAKAKLEAEHLYRTWQVVSLERLESDGEIEVRSQDVARILFGTQEDFFRQLARLDSLLDTARSKTDQPLREINLAIGAQVPVAFEDPALTPAATDATDATVRGAAAAKVSPFPVFPNLQRNKKL